jgi:hypothetical protein
MLRLCSDSSRPYPGRSARLSRVLLGRISYQSGHWYIKPGRTGRLSARASERGSKQPGNHGASRSNPWRDRTEVSRGHSSQMPGVIPGTR